MNTTPTEHLVIPRHLIEHFLEVAVPEMSALVDEMRLYQTGGAFAPKFRQILTNLKIQNWAVLYEDPANEVKVKFLLFMKPKEINELITELNAMNIEQQQEFIYEFLEDFTVDDEEDEVIPMSLEEFEALPEAERNEYITTAQMTYSFLLPLVFNYLARIVHGKSMYQLVAEAKTDKIESFLKTIQIDKSVLSTIPFFKDLNRKAADEGLFDLQRQINTYRHKPIFVSRIRHTMLWFVFAILDEMLILDEFEQDMESFANLCQRLRVYGPPLEEEVVDVESFESRLKDYKKTSRRLLPKPERRIIVKEVSSANSPP